MKYNPNPTWIEPLGWIAAVIQAILICVQMIDGRMSWFVALLPLETIVFLFIAFAILLFVLAFTVKIPDDSNYD